MAHAAADAVPAGWHPRAPRATAWLVVVGPGLLWGAAFPAIKLGLGAFTPLQLALLRVLGGALLLVALAAFAPLARVRRRDLPLLVGVGLLGFPAYQVLTNLGLATAPAGAGSLLTSLVPAIAAVCSWRWGDEPLGRHAWVGLGLATAGVWTIVAGQGGGLSPTSGFAFLLLAALCAGAYFALEKRLLRDYPARTVLTYTMLVGGAALLPFSGGLPDAARAASAQAWLVVGFLALFPTVAAFGILAWGLRRGATVSATSGIYLIPVFAFLLAWPLLGEAPRWSDLAGGALALAGVALVQRRAP